MKKKLSIMLIVIILFLNVLAIKSNAATTVTNWTNLKNIIENSNEKSIAVNLSSENTSWTADSTITIDERKKCYNYSHREYNYYKR